MTSHYCYFSKAINTSTKNAPPVCKIIMYVTLRFYVQLGLNISFITLPNPVFVKFI